MKAKRHMAVVYLVLTRCWHDLFHTRMKSTGQTSAISSWIGSWVKIKAKRAIAWYVSLACQVHRTAACLLACLPALCRLLGMARHMLSFGLAGHGRAVALPVPMTVTVTVVLLRALAAISLSRTNIHMIRLWCKSM